MDQSEQPKRLRFADFGDPDFPLAIVPALAGPYDEHTHDFFELVYICRGGGLHVIDGRPFPMLRGDVYVMHPDDVHSYRDPFKGSSIINVIFQQSFLTLPAWDALCHLPGLRRFLVRTDDAVSHKLALAPGDAYLVQSLCERMLKEFRERQAGWPIAMRAGFDELMVRIARAAQSYGQPSDDEQLHPGPVADAVARLHHEWNTLLTVRELADDACLSPNWFGEVFRQQTGLTVQAYQTKLRIDHARSLLERTSDSVLDVAIDCGYDDPSYFARVFRKTTGVTPRGYRKMLEVEK